MKDDVRVNWKKLLSRILLYFVVVLICLFILYPYFVMFCTALKSREEIFSINGTVFPIKYMWSNFVDIWSRAPMAKYMLNSILIAGGSTVCSHFNDSGFWLVKSLVGMDEKTTLKTWTIMETLVGGVGFLVALVISFFA